MLTPRDGRIAKSVDGTSYGLHAVGAYDDFGLQNEVNVLSRSVFREIVHREQRASAGAGEVVLPEEESVASAENERDSRAENRVKV